MVMIEVRTTLDLPSSNWQAGAARFDNPVS